MKMVRFVTCMIAVVTLLLGLWGAAAHAGTPPSKVESPLTHDELENLLADYPDINSMPTGQDPCPQPLK